MNSFSSLLIWRWWEPHISLYGNVQTSFCLSQLVSYKLEISSTHFTLLIIKASNYPHSPESNSIFYCTREHVMVWILLWFLFTTMIYMELVYTVSFQQKHGCNYPQACSIYLFYVGGLRCKMANQCRLFSIRYASVSSHLIERYFFLPTDLCYKIWSVLRL